MIRKETLFFGLVQGVGFRYTTRQISREFEVVGTVENLPDGSVRLIVEGTPPEIDAMIARILQAFEGRVSRSEHQEMPPTGEFSNFRVRR